MNWIPIRFGIDAIETQEFCEQHLSDGEICYLKVKSVTGKGFTYAIGWYDVDAADGFYYCDLTFDPKKNAYERKFSYLFEDDCEIIAFAKIECEDEE